MQPHVLVSLTEDARRRSRDVDDCVRVDRAIDNTAIDVDRVFDDCVRVDRAIDNNTIDNNAIDVARSTLIVSSIARQRETNSFADFT